VSEIVVADYLILSGDMRQEGAHRLPLETLFTVRILEQDIKAELNDVGNRVAEGREAELFHGEDRGLMFESNSSLGEGDMIHERLFGNVYEQLLPGLVQFILPQKRLIVGHLRFFVV
jgi:hypothetical protein